VRERGDQTRSSAIFVSQICDVLQDQNCSEDFISISERQFSKHIGVVAAPYVKINFGALEFAGLPFRVLQGRSNSSVMGVISIEVLRSGYQ
jgi:hypothetical protein